MHKTNRTDHIFRIFAGILGLLLLCLPCRAASAPISLEYSLGFDGIFRLNRGTPVSVILENRGRAVTGTLEVIVTSGSDYRGDVHDIIYSTDADLPYNSKKRYSFTVLIESFTHPLVIRLKKGGQTLVSHSINLRGHYREKDIVLAVGERVTPDFFTTLPGDVTGAVPRLGFLPDTWYGYDGVEMMILGAVSLNRLRKKQFAALKAWVEKGGTLVVEGGVNYGAFSSSRVQSFLGFSVYGYDKVQQIDSMEKFCGYSLESKDPFLILKTMPGDETVLVESGGVPVLIEKEKRDGKILFLAFDTKALPFREWEGRFDFWNSLLETITEKADIGYRLPGRKIQTALSSIIPPRFPGAGIVLLVSLVYIACIWILLKRLQKGLRVRANLFMLLILALVSSLSGSRALFHKNARQSLLYNSFIHMNLSGSNGLAQCSWVLGLYSIQPGEYGVQFGEEIDPPASIRPLKGVAWVPGNINVHEGAAGYRVKFFIEKWTRRFFELDTLFHFPFRAGLSTRENGHCLSVDNGSTHTILDCRLFYEGRVIPLGDVRAGRSVTKEFSKEDAEIIIPPTGSGEPEKGALTEKPGRRFFEEARQRLSGDLLASVQARCGQEKNTACLTGWVATEVVPLNFTSNRVSGQGLTFLEYRVPVDIYGGAP